MPYGPNPTICLVSESSAAEYMMPRSITRNYNLHNFSSRFAAENALVVSPLCPIQDPDYPFLTRKDISINGNQKSSVDGEYTATTTWEYHLPDEENLEVLSGSVSLTTQNIKYTFKHIDSYGPGTLAPMDVGGALNVGQDGIDGLDLEFPVLAFSIRKSFLKGTFNLGFLTNAFDFVGKPNSSDWRGFGEQTIKLVGVDGSNDSSEFDEVTFAFEASPTFTNITIPSPMGNIQVPEKKGWQYLHVTAIPRRDSGNSERKIWIPHTAHVDEPGPTVNLNGLI